MLSGRRGRSCRPWRKRGLPPRRRRAGPSRRHLHPSPPGRHGRSSSTLSPPPRRATSRLSPPSCPRSPAPPGHLPRRRRRLHRVLSPLRSPPNGRHHGSRSSNRSSARHGRRPPALQRPAPGAARRGRWDPRLVTSPSRRRRSATTLHPSPRPGRHRSRPRTLRRRRVPSVRHRLPDRRSSRCRIPAPPVRTPRERTESGHGKTSRPRRSAPSERRASPGGACVPPPHPPHRLPRRPWPRHRGGARTYRRTGPVDLQAPWTLRRAERGRGFAWRPRPDRPRPPNRSPSHSGERPPMAGRPRPPGRIRGHRRLRRRPGGGQRSPPPRHAPSRSRPTPTLDSPRPAPRWQG